jgi:S1-C subfamily serine protease
VIGINQQIDTTSGGNQGVGFAVPIDLAMRSVDELREDGTVDYAFLGVGTRALYPQLAERLDLDVDAGALVERVENGSPAEDAGIQGGSQQITFQGLPFRVGGDVIVAVDGKEIVNENDLADIIAREEPGSTAEFEIVRDGEHETVDVELGSRPAA